MKYLKIATLITFILFVQLCALRAQTANDLIGTWLTTDGKSKVEIVKDPNTKTFTGKIIWLKEPTEKDGSPKKDSKGNLVMGMNILNEFIFDGDEWIDGEIYDPEDGDDYYCTITLVNEDKIKVRGSIDPMGWVGRTVYWKRVVQ